MAKFGTGEGGFDNGGGSGGGPNDKAPAKLGDIFKAKTWSQLRFLYQYVLPYKWFLIFAFMFGILKTVGNLVFPYILKVVTEDLEFTTAHNGGTGSTHNIYLFGLWMVIIFVASAFVQYYRTSVPNFISSKVAGDLRVALYRHIQNLSADFYEGRRTGSIVSRLISDIEHVRMLCAEVPVAMVFDVFAFIPTAIMLWYIHPLIAITGLIPGLMYAVIHWWIGPKVRGNSKKTQQVLAQLAGTVTENIAAMRLIQSYNSEEFHTRKVSEQVTEHQALHATQAKYQGMFSGGAEFLPSLGRAGVLMVGAFLYLHPDLTSTSLAADGSAWAFLFTAKPITLGGLTAVFFLLSQLYFPLQRSSQTANQVCIGLAALDTISEFMNTPSTVKDGPGVPGFTRATGAVQFDHVSFAYPLAPTETVLKDIIADIKPGTHVALVGPSGSGKSTIAALLSRFYDPGIGAIRLDGRDLRDYSLQQLRSQIGLVMQDSILFSGTVRDNMQLGKPGADDEEITTALKNAGAWGFVSEMPGALDAVIGERGSSLSGGQKQRISIARAFLKNPAILILDEATAALDAGSEAVIQEALDRLILGKTAVIIAHRLSTVMSADLLLVLDHGQVVERGTHMELLAQDGLYAKLVRTQFGQAAKVIEASGVLRETPREGTPAAMAAAAASVAALAAAAAQLSAETVLIHDNRPLDSTRISKPLEIATLEPRPSPATGNPAMFSAATPASLAPEGIAAPASGTTEIAPVLIKPVPANTPSEDIRAYASRPKTSRL